MAVSTRAWMTVSEAAQRLRVTYAHVRNLLFTGRLKGEQIGGRYGRWMADVADVERLAKQRRPHVR